MPLLILTGYPCAGKTTRAHQIATYLGERIASTSAKAALRTARVHLINDEALGVSREAYGAAKTEKDARAAFYSAVKRALGPTDFVIADGMNYIKGFRYQLYCEAKAVRSTSCVIHVGAPIPTCRANNDARLASMSPSPSSAEPPTTIPADSPPSANASAPPPPPPYPPSTLDNLIYRYEEPSSLARWDTPLFTVPASDAAPPLDAIWSALVPAS
ncbi:chromatin associated protein KTI12, partial [Lineolata rhizophorae]